MTRYGADWILPIEAAPIRDGWVAIEGGRIVAFGRRSEGVEVDVELGRVAVLPGLVNAHTHLELSYLKGEVPPAPAFVTWIRSVMGARRQRQDPQADEILRGVERGIAEAVAAGTALVGDISNTLVTHGPLERSTLSGILFYELIRFNAADPAGLVAEACRQIDALPAGTRVRTSLAAHAPYSVAPLVFRAIREAMDRRPFVPCSVHLSESAEEVEFLESGGGPWRSLLEDLGSWDSAWRPPGVSPVHYLDEAGFLDGRTLAVHGVQMTASDLARLAARGVTLVACPRSNRQTGAGTPPIEAFYASGVRVAVGTDSLASTPDLNLFAELHAMRAIAPRVPASRLLASATIEGARALGFESEHGTIAPGKAARLIAVAVSDAVTDVEEYLVSGVQPSQVAWVGGLDPAGAVAS